MKKRAMRSILLCFLLLQCSVPDVCNAERIVVTCFGDSITAGWWVYAQDGNGCKPPCGGYEPTLKEKLVGAGYTPVIRNYGVGGEHTTSGVNRIGSVLDASNPKYVLLMEGTNDALFISPSSIVANLEFMVNSALDRRIIPILGTLTPDSNYAKPIVKINTLIKNLAAKYGIDVADHYTAMLEKWDIWNSDGIHPTLLGYTKMGRTWYKLFPPPAQPITLTFLIKCLQVAAGQTPADFKVVSNDINFDGRVGMEEAIDALQELSQE